MKKLVTILLTMILVLGLVACGGDKTDDAKDETKDEAKEVEDVAEGAKTKNITLVLSQRDEWLSFLDAAAADSAKELGYGLTSQDSLSDSNKQIQFVTTAAAAGEKVIIVNLVDPNTASEIIEAAGDMKVVFVNRPPEDMSLLNENVIYVGSDEMTSGKFQGEWLAEHFKAEGKTDIKYILLNGILGQVSTTNRTASVLKALEDNGINATEASAPIAALYDRAEAMTLITPLLTSGLEFDCIISNNDAMALGAIEALINADMDPKEIPVVGIDASPDGRQAIKDGTMAMSVFQDARGQGEGAIKAAINLVEGNPINEGTKYEVAEDNANVIWIPFEPVTGENVAEYDGK
ncbi:MAG: substrate-binding domain-containing protein [Clostridiaceae bacterium]|nr:substrate-binding domain-containing protein [Bacillota bacterium]NLN52632.1 substrate-binding domain-containing protein [Clostridiaceae bacterium]